MKKLFGFVAGAVAGTIVGAAASLIFTPESGADLKAEAAARWDAALIDARSAMEQTEIDLKEEYNQIQGS